MLFTFVSQFANKGNQMKETWPKILKLINNSPSSVNKENHNRDGFGYPVFN